MAMRMRGAVMSDATQRLALNLMGIATTYQHEQRGETPPTCTREMMLYDLVRNIANGKIKAREIRAQAQQAIDNWERSAPDTDAIKLEVGDE